MTATAERTPVLGALVIVVGVGPLGTDTYLAALPEVQRSLSTTASVAQLTITAFIIGIAAGQLTFGPISDGRGRRGMLLAGAAAFAVMSVCCALAPSGPALVALRFVQGLVGGCGVAVGRAVISDRYEGAAAAARYGALTAITLLGPILAPAIGGVILAVSDWRAVFAFLAVIGAVQIGAVLVGIPETLPPERRHGGGLAQSLGRMRELIHDRDFRRPVIVQCLATAGFFTYIGGSAFVVQEQLGFSQREYTLLFASNAVGMAIASAFFGRLVARAGAFVLRDTGLFLSTAGAVALAAYALICHPDAPVAAVTWVLLAIMVLGNGLCIPGTTAIAQQVGRRYGGTAAALQGGLTFTVGAMTTPLTGLTGHQTVFVLGLLMSAFYVAAAAFRVLSRDPRS